MQITKQDLMDMKNGHMFAAGVISCEYIGGFARYALGNELEHPCTWVAKRGNGYYDWTLHVQSPGPLLWSEGQTSRIGYKLSIQKTLEILAAVGIFFDEEATALYRS